MIYCTYCKTPTHADTSCPYQLKEATMTTPEDTELREQIFNLMTEDDFPILDEVNKKLDSVMNLITLHTNKAVAEAIGQDETTVNIHRLYLKEVKVLNKLRAEQRARADLTNPTETGEL